MADRSSPNVATKFITSCTASPFPATCTVLPPYHGAPSHSHHSPATSNHSPTRSPSPPTIIPLVSAVSVFSGRSVHQDDDFASFIAILSNLPMHAPAKKRCCCQRFIQSCPAVGLSTCFFRYFQIFCDDNFKYKVKFCDFHVDIWCLYMWCSPSQHASTFRQILIPHSRCARVDQTSFDHFSARVFFIS